MNNLDMFTQYVKDLKTTASEEYVYITRDNFFGDIIFSVNSCAINVINLPVISDKYFNKMYSINSIVKSTPAFETWFGQLNGSSYTYQYYCKQILLDKSMYQLGTFKDDIVLASNIDKINDINTDEMFYNNILLRKSDEGAGRFVYKDKIIYVAPCMLPGSKSTPIDMSIYERDNCKYFVVVFTTHKKTNDIMTMMRFLKI